MGKKQMTRLSQERETEIREIAKYVSDRSVIPELLEEITALRTEHLSLVAENTRALLDLLAQADRYKRALEFGLKVMMPEIHAQRNCWPAEVDDFEDRAREALKPDSDGAYEAKAGE